MWRKKNARGTKSAIISVIILRYYEGLFVREIIMGRIEKKWVFRAGSEKHEADNCAIVNLPREASGRWEKFDEEEFSGMRNTGLWKGFESAGAYSQVQSEQSSFYSWRLWETLHWDRSKLSESTSREGATLELLLENTQLSMSNIITDSLWVCKSEQLLDIVLRAWKKKERKMKKKMNRKEYWR